MFNLDTEWKEWDAAREGGDTELSVETAHTSVVARGRPDPSQGQRETQAKKHNSATFWIKQHGGRLKDEPQTGTKKEEEEGKKEGRKEEEVKLIRERRGGKFEQGQCEERAGELQKTTTNNVRWGEVRGGKEREEHGREKYFH